MTGFEADPNLPLAETAIQAVTNRKLSWKNVTTGSNIPFQQTGSSKKTFSDDIKTKVPHASLYNEQSTTATILLVYISQGKLNVLALKLENILENERTEYLKNEFLTTKKITWCEATVLGESE